jgi:hypothetical protein
VAIGREAIDRHQEKKKSLDITHELGTFFFFPPFSRIKKRKKGKEWLDYPSLPASYARASAPSL